MKAHLTSSKLSALILLAALISPLGHAQTAQSIALRYCSPGDYPAWTVDLAKRTPGVGWQFYKHPEATAESYLLSFMYPPGWRVSTLGRLPVMAARVTSPDGKVAMQLVMGYQNAYVTARQMAEAAINSLVGKNSNPKVLCAQQWPNSVPGLETQALAVQAGSTLYFVVGTVYHMQYTTIVDSRTVVAPLTQFDSWAQKVLAPWSNSIPKGGQGASCEEGDPDRDRDGVCDHKDLYPTDPSRW